ncbi:hypothetical protein AJ79_00876 [Helicocarpus griseus UAMH5409]|uniref:Uncharacterized protein n=1 Tax=Helicocarpus griseus UAMH5409 TaxID=1447875 RepID=A0A2B7Y912_9EURO|nr:hypothetical protein AJ79_00876 [Helicocarpus griseus UAMH5409]
MGLTATKQRLSLSPAQNGRTNGEKGDKCDYVVARAKAAAVYPKIPNVLELTVQELIENENVSNLLGKSIDFSDDDPVSFYERLQKYVDSKAKGRGKNTKGKHAAGGQKVHLHVKAPVLETGAVIVDLPGLQDSNAARAAVASRQMTLILTEAVDILDSDDEMDESIDVSDGPCLTIPDLENKLRDLEN